MTAGFDTARVWLVGYTGLEKNDADRRVQAMNCVNLFNYLDARRAFQADE